MRWEGAAYESGTRGALGHKLVYVVVVAVVEAVDVTQVPVPARPLAVAYPALGEARHPHAIDEKTVSEVKVLHLYPMHAGRHAIDNGLLVPPHPAPFPEQLPVRMLAGEGEAAALLIDRSTRVTLCRPNKVS